MKFSSKEDIEAPIAAVFEMLSEFETFERSAIRRGAEVQRLSESAEPKLGLSWDAKFMLRGKPRDLRVVLEAYDPPNAMKLKGDSQSLAGAVEIELLALSPQRTRMVLDLIVTPKTLSARLLVQSLKLAKTNLTKRYKLKIAEYAKTVEDRYRKMA